MLHRPIALPNVLPRALTRHIGWAILCLPDVASCLARVGDGVRAVDELGDVSSKLLLERLVSDGQYQPYATAAQLLAAVQPAVFRYPVEVFAAVLQAVLTVVQHMAVRAWATHMSEVLCELLLWYRG